MLIPRILGGALLERRSREIAQPAGAGGVPDLKPGFARPALPVAKIPELLKAPSAKRWIQLSIAFLPTVFAIVYFGFLAADRYVSEAQFVVRSATKQAGNLSFGSLLQMTGLGQSDDDSYTVEQYLGSREALQEIMRVMPLRRLYHVNGPDFLARYPSILYGSTDEEFYKYFQWFLTIIHDATSGITTIRVQSFTPEDSQRIVATMLDLGEQMVNRMNARVTDDALRVARQEVDMSEKRLVDSELALTNFREHELMIDPVASALIESKVEGELGGEQSQVEAQIRAMRASSPENPQLGSLQKRASALGNQIEQERTRTVAGDANNEGLADKLAQYERLVLNREFAKQMLTTATASLETSKSEARHQQLYLERVVTPSRPDYPMEPERLRTILTIFAFNVIFLLVLATIATGVREHQAGQRH